MDWRPRQGQGQDEVNAARQTSRDWMTFGEQRRISSISSILRRESANDWRPLLCRQLCATEISHLTTIVARADEASEDKRAGRAVLRLQFKIAQNASHKASSNSILVLRVRPTSKNLPQPRPLNVPRTPRTLSRRRDHHLTANLFRHPHPL